MKRHGRKILALGVVCLAFLFILSSMFGCATLITKNIPLTKEIYCSAIEKTFIVPGEFPDLYSEKEMEGYCWDGGPMSMRLYMVMYFKSDEECVALDDAIIYGLIFDTWSNEIVAAMLYVDPDIGRYWIYEDWENPKECTADEQEEWLLNYENNNSQS